MNSGLKLGLILSLDKVSEEKIEILIQIISMLEPTCVKMTSLITERYRSEIINHGVLR